MEDAELLAPQLPPGVLYPATALLALVLLFVLWRVHDRVSIFVIFAAWLRYVVQAYHTTTHGAVFAGLSWNALSSVLVFALGLLVIRWRNLMLRFLLPVYLLIALVLISGIANGAYSGLLNVTVKYGYFIVVTLAVFEALETFGERFMSMLLWAFTPPLFLQLLSIIFNVTKVTDADGSRSYIGGYSHEAGFSVTLATCLLVACFATNLSRVIRNGIILLCLIGIFIANYRTTIVAIMPLLLAQFSLSIVSGFRREQKIVVGMAGVVLALTGVIVASWFLQQRFQDLAIVLEGDGMIKPPADFSVVDVEIMSGRPYIWSNYIYGYLNGGGVQHLVGFGPESWTTFFSVYAHNTLISHLYEYGPLGVILVIYFWASMIFAAWRVREGPKVKLLAAHASFILLNMATMPLWMLEGNILYGILCGYTLYLQQRRREYRPQRSWLRSRPTALAVNSGRLRSVPELLGNGRGG